jgi:hypothetical protein
MRTGHLLSLGVLLSATFAAGQGGIGPITTQVPKAKQDVGHPATTIAPGYRMKIVAQGTDALENPSGLITTFGRLKRWHGYGTGSESLPGDAIESGRTGPGV